MNKETEEIPKVVSLSIEGRGKIEMKYYEIHEDEESEHMTDFRAICIKPTGD